MVIFLLLAGLIIVSLLGDTDDTTQATNTIDLVRPWPPGESKVGVIVQDPKPIVGCISVVRVEVKIGSTRWEVGAFVSTSGTTYFKGDSVRVTLADTYFKGKGDYLIYHFAEKS